MSKIVGNVFKTTDYSIFKIIVGNRNVEDNRVNKIIESIKNVGLVLAPIIVNKRMEVIDGQGRLLACRELGLPVYYVIDENAGIEQCISLNISSTSWSREDYIRSYSDSGNKNYTNLQELIDMFPNISTSVIAYAINDCIGSQRNRVRKNGKFLGRTDIICSGRFICTDEQKQNAYDKLLYVQRFIDIAKRVNGNSSTFLYAILFVAFYANADKNRLYKTIFERQQEFVPFTSIRTCLQSINDVYNFNNKKNKRNFVIDYENFIIEYGVSGYVARLQNDQNYGKLRKD